MLENPKSGLKLAGGVVDLAKNIKELSEKIGNLELQEAAAELRSQTLDLKEEVNDMRMKIIELEKQLEFKKQLRWNGQTFEYEENGRKIYICNGCEPNGKYTHMSEIRNQRGYHAAECPVCNNKVVFAAGELPKRITSSGGRGRAGGWQDL